MKKSLLALSAAAIALSGMAASPKQMLQQGSARIDRNAPIQSHVSKLRSGAAKAGMMKASAEASSADIIRDVEGTVQNMAYTGTGYLVSYFGLMAYENETISSHIVYGEGNEVYLYDFLPYSDYGSYVKGVKEDGKITISLPQVVDYYDEEGYGLELCLLGFEVEDEETGEGWYYESDDKSVTFSVAEDGSMVAEGLNDDLILGVAWTDDKTWGYLGVSELSAVVFNESPVTPPSDSVVSENFWVCKGDDYGWPVSWVQGYDEFYFKGICPEMPDAWVKGTVEYGDSEAIISIAQNQYVGIFEGHFIRTKCAGVETVYDEEWDMEYEVYVDLPEDYCYQLVWDYEENTIRAKDPEIAFLFNASENDYLVLREFYDLSLAHQDSYEGTPANPFDLEYYDGTEYGGYFEFHFVVPGISTEGDVLLTDDLYYIVYVDGEQWTFEPEEYGTEEAIDEIPWNLSLYYIYNWGGAEREVDFFVEGISTLGVQSVYKYNGEETRSEIVSIDLEADPDAVGTVNAGKKVASVKYYGLDGREVANPAAGIFVKRVIFEDGSIATFKKAIR